MISQPKNLSVNLFPHQLVSVYNMEQLEEQKRVKVHDGFLNTLMGINGDITGYGKTLSMIALILRNKMMWNNDDLHCTKQIYSSDSMIYKETLSFHHKIDTTLILVNQSLVTQWKKEFSYTPLRVAYITTKRLVNTVDAMDYDVVVVTPSMFNKYVERYHDMAWKRFIFDEPANIRVPKMRSIIAGFTWLVTATPNNMYGIHRNVRSSFMKSIISNFYFFDHINIRNDENFIRESWTMPPTHHEYYECFSSLYKTLKGLVSNRILKLVDANNINGVILALGGNKTDNIAELIRSKKLRELEEIDVKIRLFEIRNNREMIEKLLEDKERVKKQIDELDRRFENLLTQQCSICFTTITSPVMEPLCQNIFCTKCLLTWLQTKNNCPLCRQEVNTNDLVYVNTGGECKTDDTPLPTKENMIIDIIGKKKDGKFIIFSSFNETFSRITKVLKEHNISFLEVKGSVTTMSKRIDDFRSGKIQVIFLNSKHNGTGLNLQEATDVIIYHKMGETLLTQVLGRPNRIGRTIPLTVHHLIYAK